jgi:hypothetical protein
MAKPATKDSVRRTYLAQLKVVKRLEQQVNKARKTLAEKETPLKVAKTRLDYIAGMPVFDENGQLIEVDFSDLEVTAKAQVQAEDATEAEDVADVEDTAAPDEVLAFN